MHDKLGRGRITEDLIAALAIQHPRTFRLENVKGLVTHHRATFHHIIQELRLIGNAAYRVGYKIIDAADHGLPQHRMRVYIVGLLRNNLGATRRFKWPESCERLPSPDAPMAAT